MANVLDGIPWARRLKLRHLEVFLAVHETGSVTAAAAQLHMTQPALSHWLSDVEDAIGCPLFSRGRRLELTLEGEVLRAHAARMLGDVSRTHVELKAVQAGLHGRLHVGTGLPRVLLPKAIARLQDGRPGVFVTAVEAPLPQLLEMLARRDLDVIIGALAPQALASGFSTEALLPDCIQVVARQGHPALRGNAPSKEEIAAYPWILPPVGSVMRDSFDTAFAFHGLAPPIPCVEATSSLRMQLLMGDRNYLTILSASELQVYRPLGLLEHVRMPAIIPSPDIGAIWEAGRANTLVSHFLNALRAEASIIASSSPTR